MRNKYIKWDKLDNTANLFPVIVGDSLTNTYRISATLSEDVVPELLQEALDILTPRIPGFNLRLRNGIFWYYFEENGQKSKDCAKKKGASLHPSSEWKPSL